MSCGFVRGPPARAAWLGEEVGGAGEAPPTGPQGTHSRAVFSLTVTAVAFPLPASLRAPEEPQGRTVL